MLVVLASLSHALVLGADWASAASGSVAAWGYNADGELGNGSTSNSSVPVQVSGALSSVATVAVGEFGSMAVRSGGTVWQWGDNTYGELGNNTTTNSLTPVEVVGQGGTGTLSGVKSVAQGVYHSLAVKSDGSVWSWGYDRDGELGVNSTTNSSTPLEVFPTGWADSTGEHVPIAAGAWHSLALKSDGTVWAWGQNGFGQLGINSTASNSTTPVEVVGAGGTGALSGVVAVAAGFESSAALKSDGTVWTWGYNGFGELGNNTTTPSSTPVEVVGPGGAGVLSGVVAIAANYGDTLALKSDGTVWAWGDNTYGQLGINSFNSSLTPVEVLGPGGAGNLSGIVGLAAGRIDGVALGSDGTVWSWGDNESDQLGNGSTAETSKVPVQVSGIGGLGVLTGVSALGTTCCGFHALALVQASPAVATGSASSISQSAATLAGSVNPEGASVTDCHFDWGTLTGYGHSVPCAQSVGSGSSAVPVSATVSGLSPGTVYHFRVVATNSGGSAFGDDQSFTTTAVSVNVAATAVSVVCSPGLVVVGQSSACVTTVSSVSGVPGGVVRFGSGGAGSFAAGGSCALSGSGASASCSVLYTPSGVGSDTITASYGGDASHAGSSGSTVLVVGPAVGGGASVVVACSPGTVTAGQSTRCTVKVASLSGGGPSPTGIVQMVGGGGPALSGGGSCTLAPASASTAVCSTVFTVGAGASNTYMVIATYGGDGNYASGSGLTSFAAAAPAGVAAAVAVVRGVVSIKDSTGTFIPIKGSTVSVPVNSTIDATKGVIRVSTAADYRPVTDPRHHEQVGTFSEAIFEIKQLTKRQALARLRAKQRRRLFQIIPSTDLQLLSAPGALTKARCRPHSPNPGNGLVRAITGTAKGFYRTLAANSITTIHNATWIVEDRCDATITEVGKGTATVTPTHQPHPHPITIHAGQSVTIKGVTR